MDRSSMSHVNVADPPRSVQRSDLDTRYAALADPTRLAILDLLRARDQCVCHLVEALGLGQSIVSHHVGVLRRAGIVASYPHATDRRWLYYRIDRAALTPLAAHLYRLQDAAGYNPEPLPCAADDRATGA
jgi:ArsR family transcriptional regulator